MSDILSTDFDQTKLGNVEQPDGTYHHDEMFPEWPEDHYFNSEYYAAEVEFSRRDLDY